MRKYLTYIEFKITHGYYPNGLSNSFNFVPDATTRNFLNRYKCKIVQSQNGFSLLVPENINLTSLALNLSLEELLFLIHCGNPGLVSISDIAPNWSGSINLIGTNNGEINLDLVNNSTPPNGCIGYLKLPIKKQNYSFHLKARSTIWKYYVINRSSIDIEEVEISSRDGFKFSGPSKTTITTGETAWVFDSGNTHLPMQQQPTTQYQLKIKNKVVRKDLPYPDPQNLEIESQGSTNHVFSTMYVYV